MIIEPGSGFRLGNHGQNVHAVALHIIKNSDRAESKAVLWRSEPAQTLDSTFRHARRLMLQISVNGIDHSGTFERPDSSEIFPCLVGPVNGIRQFWLDAG